jgi:hypothetical protein
VKNEKNRYKTKEKNRGKIKCDKKSNKKEKI